jgi:hypothetical protein
VLRSVAQNALYQIAHLSDTHLARPSSQRNPSVTLNVREHNLALEVSGKQILPAFGLELLAVMDYLLTHVGKASPELPVLLQAALRRLERHEVAIWSIPDRFYGGWTGSCHETDCALVAHSPNLFTKSAGKGMRISAYCVWTSMRIGAGPASNVISE